jgi:hypothetical protein
MTACHDRLEKVADQIRVSVVSDSRAAMHARAELDDRAELARLVGAPCVQERHEAQQSASGAPRPCHQTLRPLLHPVMSLLTFHFYVSSAIELAVASPGLMPELALRHAVLPGIDAAGLCRMASTPGDQQPSRGL